MVKCGSGGVGRRQYALGRARGRQSSTSKHHIVTDSFIKTVLPQQLPAHPGRSLSPTPRACATAATTPCLANTQTRQTLTTTVLPCVRMLRPCFLRPPTPQHPTLTHVHHPLQHNNLQQQRHRRTSSRPKSACEASLRKHNALLSTCAPVTQVAVCTTDPACRGVPARGHPGSAPQA